MKYNLDDTEIIAPNFKKRLSGVTSSIIQLLPQMRKHNIKVSALGFGLPMYLPFISFFALKNLWTPPKNRDFYIFHARRHTEMIFGIILRDILKARLKLVFTAAAQRRQKRFTYYLMSKMDRLIAANDKISRFLKSPNISIMHGIDTERFKPGRSTLTIPNSTKYIIGCCGRVRFSKGTDIFVDSMIELLPQFKYWIAVFSGRITPENKLYADKIFTKIKQANLQHRILYLGELSNQGIDNDINFLYKKLDLYIAPPRNEGFGLTPLEAMSSGVPCITSDTGSYAEIITSNCGRIVKNINAKNLSIEIKYFFQHPEKLKQMGIEARKHIMSNYSLSKEIAQLQKLYEELFANG